jgi:hypothetical protein
MHSSSIDNVSHLLQSHRLILKEEKAGERHAGTHGLGLLVSNSFPGLLVTINDSNLCTHVLWARATVYNRGFIIGCVYIPNESSIHFDSEWSAAVINDILSLSDTGLPLILLGDFNARTGNLDDFMDCDNFVAHECGLDVYSDVYFDKRDVLASDNFHVTRHNCDRTINNNGRKLVELCQILNLKILNGRCGADKEKGEYTCRTANGQSTVDYALISSDSIPNISDFHVDNFDPCLSDAHSPILLELVFARENPSPEPTSTYQPTNAASTLGGNILRTRWEKGSTGPYRDALAAQNRVQDLEQVLTQLEQKTPDDHVTRCDEATQQGRVKIATKT